MLFSGDGDFRRLVEAVQRKGVRVTVVSTIRSSPPMVADELRRQADIFIDLERPAPTASPACTASGRQSTAAANRATAADVGARLAAKRACAADQAEPVSAAALASANRRRTARSARGSRRFAPTTARPIPTGTTRRCRPSAPPDARLLIVGLAPGLKGANRTGRPFTGDFAGDLLYRTLLEFGFASGNYGQRPDDGLELVDCRITNAVRCVPPENKPTPAESQTCRPFLAGEIGGARRGCGRSWRSAASPTTAVLAALGRRAVRVPLRPRRRHELPTGLALCR